MPIVLGRLTKVFQNKIVLKRDSYLESRVLQFYHVGITVLYCKMTTPNVGRWDRPYCKQRKVNGGSMSCRFFEMSMILPPCPLPIFCVERQSLSYKIAIGVEVLINLSSGWKRSNVEIKKPWNRKSQTWGWALSCQISNTIKALLQQIERLAVAMVPSPFSDGINVNRIFPVVKIVHIKSVWCLNASCKVSQNTLVS